jgi:hypothetical protein
MRDTFQRLWQTAGATHIASALFGNGGQFAQYWEADEADLARVNHWISNSAMSA